MQIKSKKVDVSIEKRILTAFITSQPYLKKIQKIYNKDYFSTPASRKIAKWCLSYYKKYDKAPNKHIQDIFLEKKKEGLVDEVELEFIESILSTLSEDWEKESSFDLNTLLDQTAAYFLERQLTVHRETIDELLSNNQYQEAQQIISEFKPVQIKIETEYCNPLLDEDGMREALRQKKVALFKMPGALGKMVNSQIYKSAFMAIQAPEKSAKSFLLQEFVMRAIRQKVKVALFELGDLSKNDRYCRIGTYVAKKPFDYEQSSDDGVIVCKVPKLIESEGEYAVEIEDVRYEALQEDDAIKACQKWIKRCGKDCLRVSIHSSDSTSIENINDILLSWKEEDDWVPDMIAIDYPDIAAKEKGSFDERGSVNARWKAQRRLSQDWNAFVLAVTQADAGSYGKSAQTLKNFSEDKRKYSHITSMFAINQTLQEKTQNIFRLAPLLIREGRVDMTKHVCIVHCLDLGRPYMFSFEVSASKFNDEDNEDD